MSPRRNQFTVREKVNVIKFKQDNPSWGVRKIAETFKISKCYVSNILRSKEDILRLFETSGCENRVRNFKQTELMKVDQVVFQWFSQIRSMNLPVSGSLIQEKAKEAASALRINNFAASNGWLEKFRKRHGISFKLMSSEKKSVSPVTAEEWIQKIPQIVSGYSLVDIFNAGETGLYYRAMPNKILCFKREKSSGGKKAKERLTILLCCNLTGEKLTPLVIGRAAKPSKNIKLNTLPVYWKHNKKAWMTRDIMSEWLMQLNHHMKRENRKIILFLDNATSHQDLNLENIKVVFFPPNCTSRCQPLDQGVIAHFKEKYRTLLLKSFLANTEQEQSFSDISKDVDVLQAINWVSQAWNDVSSTTIFNCFSKAGFNLVQLKAEEAEENLNSQKLQQLLAASGNDSVNALDFISFDNELDTEDIDLDIGSMVNNMTGYNENNVSDEESSDVDENSQMETEPLKTHKEVLKQIKCVRNFFLYKGDDIALNLINQLTLHVEDDISKSMFSK